MALLPKNEPKHPIETPRNYFIWGPTMSGKTYLSEEFPNPLNLNTDGNADMIETPSINLRNERDKTGKISYGVIDQLNDIIKELETTQHTFETIVIDVIDDVVTLMEQQICEENDVKYIGDLPFGKGFGLFKSYFTALVVKLKSLPFNVIYVSRYSTVLENKVERPVPSLAVKHLNIVNGNCDLNIMTQKIGKKHLRRVVDRRKNYQREHVKDERILKILDTIIGAFDRSVSATTDEAKALVEQQEQQTDGTVVEQPGIKAPRPPRTR